MGGTHGTPKKAQEWGGGIHDPPEKKAQGWVGRTPPLPTGPEKHSTTLCISPGPPLCAFVGG